ncbi:hypothetical protein PCASD_17503 [Puccinia coronata f. sp. avenae]|uniref:ER membrane protein complex subunit 2 n=1 Tax=Puccinia coronata f. sp. avenae TaxID=200324 RepID=A0A2N5TW88_9BASI|nr:hypothetical protein PCASD_17503 [Puccinia coronata f. sp. avenae]
MIYKQIAVAALDIGDVQMAKTTIQRLETKFPNLARVTALHGMFLEAQGDFLGAKSFYKQELEKKFNPKNAELGSVRELNIHFTCTTRLLLTPKTPSHHHPPIPFHFIRAFNCLLIILIPSTLIWRAGFNLQMRMLV